MYLQHILLPSLAVFIIFYSPRDLRFRFDMFAGTSSKPFRVSLDDHKGFLPRAAWFFHLAHPGWSSGTSKTWFTHPLVPAPLLLSPPLPDRSSCTLWQAGHVISRIPAALPCSQHFCQHSIWWSNFKKRLACWWTLVLRTCVSAKL